MTEQSNTDKAHKDQVFRKLRREILAARLKVTLDEQLKRPTSPTVKKLSAMKLPAIVRTAEVPVVTTNKVDKRAAGGKVHYSAAKQQSRSTRRMAS
ncbi:hypothetical protein [Paenarthrobacter sp. A20]|uniref:hypothetical protein n=1 Tax=Paenarthrobacter sp. A20 TaxID=2817891 RepID=UPI00209F9A10|nr:hypothetical protein [Paenarthrobacter sp. A20]MCP1413685.1 hypothetical protein [Paenarthrobacter sp. A20]